MGDWLYILKGRLVPKASGEVTAGYRLSTGGCLIMKTSIRAARDMKDQRKGQAARSQAEE
jgi:hypothetical protein